MRAWECAVAAAVGAAFAWGSSASAAIHTFPTVYLDGLQEVPPNATPATGIATVTYDDVSNLLSVSGSYSGLVANATAAHVHGLAAAGVNAGVIFSTPPTGGTTGTFAGSGTLTATQEVGLFNNQTYINVHTAALPGGEIRGQIIVPEPAATAALALIAGSTLMTRRRRL